MGNRYLLLKHDAEGRSEPIDSFTASGMEEAKDALRWMRMHHPEREDLKVGAGEFFEILEEEHCPPEEWKSLLERLDRKRGAQGKRRELRDLGKGI